MGELARPSVVAEILERHGLHPSRSLGQHFLVDGNMLRLLLDAAELSPRDTVLEIGPGLGTLTEELCARAGRVVAVEMDRRFAAILPEVLGAPRNLLLVEGDALRLDLAHLFPSGERVKVVSNLPYNVATPLIIRLLLELPQAEVLVVTVQRELADRYLAGPRGDAYGGVAVKVQTFCDMRRVCHLPPTVFFPPPRVDSCALRMERKASDLAPGETAPFFRFVDACFSFRRKMLVNALAGGREPYRPRSRVEEALRRLGLSPACRAEELSRDELLLLFRALEGEG
ncbi:MAG: ribosomal RNA small subunit methyltransferase A [Actinobacteria bacterium]|nr:ribosomal RNA small subunit methyltransferase A [Actinomycetota bacterium]